jgi:hypothetical protein
MPQAKDSKVRSVNQLTWRDALIIELRSMTDRVEQNMPVAGITITRLQGLFEEYEKERTRL